MTRRQALRAAVAAAIAALVVGAQATTALAANYVPVSGSGSTWSQNALDQWRRDVNQFGLQVNYAGTGSSDGRNQFRSGTVDFAVSEIPYGITQGGNPDPAPSRPFAYMPIVAGGTSLMYNLQIGGKAVTNLRLSGEVVTKIFTGVITTWNDAAIAKDNPGLVLPARRIVPVVRSDGSGTSAQFTTWMATQHGALWDAYCRQAGLPTPCGTLSQFPVIPGKGFTAQSGSLGVAGYVSQKANIGTITYVEYSYALNSGYPVAKLLNSSGYFVEPTASAVAVALLKAKIRSDLTSDLSGVYDSTDPRAYPMSSYSYMIVPTATTSQFSTDKGKALSAFANYFLCEGQRKAPLLGYSPLPINLVQEGLTQVKRIPGAVVESINIKSCNNPTFSADGTNTLAATAPQPPACDRAGGVTQCATGTGGAANIPTAVKAGPVAGPSPTPSGSTAPTPGSTSGAGGKGTGGTGSGTPASPGSGTSAGTGTGAGGDPLAGGDPQAGGDPLTGGGDPLAGGGDPLAGAGDGGTGDGTGGGTGLVAVASPLTVSADRPGSVPVSIIALALLVLLGVVVLPPVVSGYLSSRGSK